MPHLLAGVDIGGTKCAVSFGEAGGGPPRIVGKRRFPTPPTPAAALEHILAELSALCAELGAAPAAAGVSCGGPLDSARGLVLSPPNLPGWDGVDVLTPLRERLGVGAALRNDADACALAEWRWGAGRGLQHVVFLTFGTGMGAGLILGGRLHVGASDMAGEVGHLRLAEHGPVGYGKLGSFEGFCSGAGIAQLGRRHAEAELQLGRRPALCPRPEDLPALTAEAVALAARAGDPLALRVFDVVARKLGQGLAILIDVLNPERVVIGSIFARQRELIEPVMLQVLAEECLPRSLAACQVVPAALGEQVGDYAALAVAHEALP